jgi:hypothetical protein
MYYTNARLYHASKRKRMRRQSGVRMDTARRVVNLFSPNVPESYEFFINPAAYFVMKEHWSMDG